jgi:hypothetical protein
MRRVLLPLALAACGGDETFMIVTIDSVPAVHDVQKIEVEEGEVIDPQRPAITIVRNDPLWVEARVPTRRALGLKLGQQLDVLYKNEPGARKAEIIYFDPVALAGSNFQIVRLAMPNPDNRPSGMLVDVGTGLTDAEREAPPRVGQRITIKYQELTPAGVPRFPVFVAVRDYE